MFGEQMLVFLVKRIKYVGACGSRVLSQADDFVCVRLRTLKMRELEAKTGVGRETIRFYIREGMLPQPEKPKRNVANYSAEHVVRLKLIKELQEKRFLPLKLVKAMLDSPNTQELVATSQVQGIEHFLPGLLDSTPAVEKSVAQVAKMSGLSSQEIEQIAKAGVISISADQTIDFRDAAIIETWGEANSQGFDRQHGYGPEFLQVYVAALKHIAEHEVGLFMDSLGAGLDGREAAQIGAKGVNVANKLLTLLHTKLILSALNERARL